MTNDGWEDVVEQQADGWEDVVQPATAEAKPVRNFLNRQWEGLKESGKALYGMAEGAASTIGGPAIGTVLAGAVMPVEAVKEGSNWLHDFKGTANRVAAKGAMAMQAAEETYRPRTSYGELVQGAIGKAYEKLIGDPATLLGTNAMNLPEKYWYAGGPITSWIASLPKEWRGALIDSVTQVAAGEFFGRGARAAKKFEVPTQKNPIEIEVRNHLKSEIKNDIAKAAKENRGKAPQNVSLKDSTVTRQHVKETVDANRSLELADQVVTADEALGPRAGWEDVAQPDRPVIDAVSQLPDTGGVPEVPVVETPPSTPVTGQYRPTSDPRSATSPRFNAMADAARRAREQSSTPPDTAIPAANVTVQNEGVVNPQQTLDVADRVIAKDVPGTVTEPPRPTIDNLPPQPGWEDVGVPVIEAQPAPPKTGRYKPTAKSVIEQARELGLEAKQWPGHDLYTIGDPVTRGNIEVRPGESVAEKLKAKRAEFQPDLDEQGITPEMVAQMDAERIAAVNGTNSPSQGKSSAATNIEQSPASNQPWAMTRETFEVEMSKGKGQSWHNAVKGKDGAVTISDDPHATLDARTAKQGAERGVLPKNDRMGWVWGDDPKSFISVRDLDRAKGDFYDAWAKKAPRTAGDIAKDIGTTVKGVLDEKGALSYQQLNPTQQAAVDRLRADLDNIRSAARAQGLSIRNFLESQGIDPDVIANVMPGHTAGAVKAMYDRTEKAIDDKHKVNWSQIRASLAREVVDERANVKRALLEYGPYGKEAKVRRNLVAGASGKAGTIIEKAHDEIYAPLTAKEREVLNRVVQSRRTIDIDNYKSDIKHPEGLGEEAHMQYIEDIMREEGLTRSQAQKIWDASEQYGAVMKTQLDELRAEGLISDAAYDAMQSHYYSKREFMQHLDPEYEVKFGNDRRMVTDSGIKSLDEGSLELLENNSERLMAEVVARTQSRIFNNRANVALHDLADNVRGNGIVSMDPQSPKDVAIRSYVNGQERTVYMRPEYAKEWIGTDPHINATFASISSWLMGAPILKATATGYNPAFIITNMPRDIALVWSHDIYSAHLPVAVGQLAKDFAKVAGDVWKRKGRVVDYANEGGEMAFLTDYGRFRGQGHVTERINSITNALGYLGKTSELWTRIALRERALEKGYAPHQATEIARDYLDFNQGGSTVKAIDKLGFSYLNAGVQGTRSIMRAAKEHPVKFGYKMAQLGTVATGLYYANQLINPEAWSQIPDRVKEANFIITTPWSTVGKDGQKRYVYFKIAKDQGQRLITSVFESLMARQFEGKLPTKQVLLGLGELASVPFIDNFPPTMSAVLGYMLNKDFWTMDDIWKGTHEKIDPSQEWNMMTSPVAKQAGKIGLSPERTEYAVGRVISSGNPFVSMVGGGIKALIGETEDRTLSQMIMENDTVKRVASLTDPLNPYRETNKNLRQDAATQTFTTNRDLDILADKYFKNPTDDNREAVRSFIAGRDETEADRLTDRLEKLITYRDLPDRTWWLDLSSAKPEVRAEMFWERYSKANDEQQQALKGSLARVADGVVTDRFVDRLAELMESNAKK